MEKYLRYNVGKLLGNTNANGKVAGICKRIIDFIGKDIKAKNESKKPVVVIRILLISILLYFTCNILFCIPKISVEIILFYLVVLALFAGIFAISYYCRTVVILFLFNIGMIVWIWTILYLLGWNVGVQHFLMVLLVLCFFSTYNRLTVKGLYALFLCILRILFFYVFYRRTPHLELTSADGTILQIINTITIFWCISMICSIFSNDGQKLESKLVDYNAMLEKQANTDTLTGLYNRRKALEYMESLVEGNDHAELSVCICDIDFFKKVNDNYGHDFGDEVLREVSRVLREEMKSPHFAARWGGEEFLLLFVGCNGDEAFTRLSQLRLKIKSLRVKGGEAEVGVTMTFGLTEYDYGTDLNTSIKRADQNLYAGKEQGRDRIIY